MFSNKILLIAIIVSISSCNVYTGYLESKWKFEEPDEFMPHKKEFYFSKDSIMIEGKPYLVDKTEIDNNIHYYYCDTFLVSLLKENIVNLISETEHEIYVIKEIEE